MKYIVVIITFFAFVMFNSFKTYENNFSNNTTPNIEDTTKPKPTGPMGYKPFLGCSTTIDGGVQDKNTIVEMLQLPLCVRDKNGQTYMVKEFLLTYSERGVYQDSTGLPVVVTDYTTIQVDSNQIAEPVFKSLKDRLYKGDTLTFSDVYIQRNNGLLLVNKDLKVVVR